jgi:hypothetical protein
MAKRLLTALSGLVILVALGSPISRDAADAAPAAPAPASESVSADGELYSPEAFKQHFGDQPLNRLADPGGEDEGRRIAFTTKDTRKAAAAAWVEDQVAAILRNNLGSQRIGANEVELAEGVVVTVSAQPSAVQGCPAYHLCLNEHSNFGGEQLKLYACRNVNLGNLEMRDGRRWNDKVSSIRNAQVGSGAQARFYNYDGSGDPGNPRNWRLILALNPGRYLRDLSKDSSADGGDANDKIDIVHVCGN